MLSLISNKQEKKKVEHVVLTTKIVSGGFDFYRQLCSIRSSLYALK